jgi:RNA polymerase sigma-70 factor (ECF subfamily)
LDPVHEWFDPIYLEHRSLLLRIAKRLMRRSDSVEDMVQTVFLIMLTKHKELVDHPNIRGWLVLTLRNQIMTEQQKAYHSREVEFSEKLETVATAPSAGKFMDELPPGLTDAERELLYLHIEAGYHHKEIAEYLGCSPEACRMRLLRAKHHCAKLMEESFQDKPLHTTEFDQCKEQEV